jgi:hypothetical protein
MNKMKKIFILLCCILSFLNNQAQLQFSSGINWKSSAGTYVVLDNMSLQHDAASASLDNIFKFTGNMTASINGGSLPLFTNIEVALTGTAKIILQRTININQGLSFQSGLIDLNNNNIDLGTMGAINGESETSRIVGDNGGYIQIMSTLNSPSSLNPGNLGVMFTSSQNFGSTVIRRGHQSQSIANHQSINRYFDISPANNTLLNATLRFTYFDAELNGIDENTILLWKSPDNVNWNEIGFDSRSTITNYVEKTGIGDFSRWTLQLPSNALPVTFVYIRASCTGGKILISWKTAQEINSSHFDIERSPNGINWTPIGTIPSSGNSLTEKTYTYSDTNPLPANGFYRIAEYDQTGRVLYTTVSRANCDRKDGIKVWPNPVEQTAWLSINLSVSSSAIIKLYDAKGSLVFIRSTFLAPGNNQLPILMGSLPAGIYELRVQYGAGLLKTFKLVKQL